MASGLESTAYEISYVEQTRKLKSTKLHNMTSRAFNMTICLYEMTEIVDHNIC